MPGLWSEITRFEYRECLMLVKYRNCSNSVSTETENCPNCRNVYPSLSEKEIWSKKEIVENFYEFFNCS